MERGFPRIVAIPLDSNVKSLGEIHRRSDLAGRWRGQGTCWTATMCAKQVSLKKRDIAWLGS